MPAAGSYRAFADFTPTGGRPLTLGVDLAAAGDVRPRSGTSRPDRAGRRLHGRARGDLVPGQASPLTLTVTRDGEPVTDLQPYLGAYGHLVALREGDLAYLHVHPDGAPGDGLTAAGPQIRFVAEVPSAGDLPAVPGLPARRRRPHRRVHRAHRRRPASSRPGLRDGRTAGHR